jgi:hypothetical protein
MLVLSAGLAVLAVGALGVSSASAATAPALKVCLKLPTGLKEHGLWNTSNCEGANVTNGAFAWSWADKNGEATVYCLLGGKLYAESLCETDNGTGPFLESLQVEPFPRLLGLLLLSLLTGHAAGTATKIHCEDGKFSGTPATATLNTETTIDYTGCISTEPAGCEVSNPGSKTLGLLITNKLDGRLESLTLTNFTPETGTKFIEIEYHGTPCKALLGIAFPITGSQMCEFEASASTPAIEQLLTCKTSGSSLKLGTENATYEGKTHIHLEGLPYWKIR